MLSQGGEGSGKVETENYTVIPKAAQTRLIQAANLLTSNYAR